MASITYKLECEARVVVMVAFDTECMKSGTSQTSLMAYNCLATSISGLVVEYIAVIDVTRVQFPADALLSDAVGRFF